MKQETLEYFIEIVNEVNPTHKVIINLLYSILNDYYYEETDIEFVLCDILFLKISYI